MTSQPANYQVLAGLVSTVLAMTAAAAAPVGSISAPHAPQFMLYLSRSLGGGGGSAHSGFSLHLEQVRVRSNLGDPMAGDPMSHRELVNWQMEPRAGFQLELGQKVTWDVTNRSLSRRPQTWSVTFEAGMRPGRTANGPQPAAFALASAFSARTDSAAAISIAQLAINPRVAKNPAVAELLRASDPQRAELGTIGSSFGRARSRGALSLFASQAPTRPGR